MKRKIISCISVLLILLTFFTFTVSADEYGIMPASVLDYDIVEEAVKGGDKYLSDSKLGTITREKIVAELSDHENDKYYLGTQYVHGDWQSPVGDTSYNGSSGMNCSGFICYVLRKCGLNAEVAIKYVKSSDTYSKATSDRPYDLISKASNYYELIKQADLITYSFKNKSDMLKSGKCAKGDLILMYVNRPSGLDSGEDNHLSFFWGDTSSEDKCWHSVGTGNSISKIKDINANYLLIKIDEKTSTSDINNAQYDSYITVNSAKLMDTPSSKGKVVAELSANTPLILISKENYLWYKVKTTDGKTGYISTAKVIPETKKYNVVFDVAGSTTFYESLKLRKDESFTLPASPQKEGYTFLGWGFNNKEVLYSSGQTLTCNGDITYYAVFKDNNATVSKIEINTMPQRIYYLVGEELDIKGTSIKVTYSDGTSHTVSEGFEVTGFDSAEIGVKTLTLTYQGVSISFNVEVMEYIPGDIDLNKLVNRDDVMTLLWHITFPEDFPITVPADFNGDTKVNRDDVMALLWHITFPDEFPLTIS